MDTPEADEKILHYCMEGIRLNGTFGSYRESTTSMDIDDGGKKVSVNPGDKVFVSFVKILSIPSYSFLQSNQISGRRSSQPGCFPLARRGQNRPTTELVHPLWGGPPRMPRKRRQPRLHHSHDEGCRKVGQSPASARSARPAEENPASRRLLYFHESRPRQLLAVSR